MADREKVIKGLRFCFNEALGILSCDGCVYSDRRTVKNGVTHCYLGDDAIALLEEQEAKQIVRKQCKKEYEDGSIDYFAEWYCPHCELLILRGFDNPSIKFCYKCGKPILWEGR